MNSRRFAAWVIGLITLLPANAQEPPLQGGGG